jgi:hypothetical protein
MPQDTEKETESHGKRLLAKVVTRFLSSHVQTRGFAALVATTSTTKER